LFSVVAKENYDSKQSKNLVREMRSSLLLGLLGKAARAQPLLGLSVGGIVREIIGTQDQMRR
jgi:hypothetical protein